MTQLQSSDPENSNRRQQNTNSSTSQTSQQDEDEDSIPPTPPRLTIFNKIKNKYNKTLNNNTTLSPPNIDKDDVRRNGIDPTVIPGTNIKKFEWFQSFGRWLLHQFGEPNFIKIHYLYILLWIFVGSIMLVGPSNIAYIDAFFLATSASTQGGMNT